MQPGTFQNETYYTIFLYTFLIPYNLFNVAAGKGGSDLITFNIAGQFKVLLDSDITQDVWHREKLFC